MQRSPLLLSGPLTAGLLLLPLLGLAVCGWWLAALAAPWPIWGGSILLLSHLAFSGTAGIVLATLWVTALLGLMVAGGHYPSFWPETTHYRFWARTVLLLWGVGLTTVSFVGIQGQQFNTSKQRGAILALTILSLWGGGLLYRQSFLP